MRAQPVADHLFPSADGGLGLGAFRVPGRPLPGPAPVVGDMLEVAVPLGRRALSCLARHGGRARRHNNGRRGVALGDAGVNTVLPDLNTWFGQVSGRARIFGKFKRVWHYAGAVPGASVRSVEAQPPREAARLP